MADEINVQHGGLESVLADLSGHLDRAHDKVREAVGMDPGIDPDTVAVVNDAGQEAADEYGEALDQADQGRVASREMEAVSEDTAAQMDAVDTGLTSDGGAAQAAAAQEQAAMMQAQQQQAAQRSAMEQQLNAQQQQAWQRAMAEQQNAAMMHQLNQQAQMQAMAQASQQQTLSEAEINAILGDLLSEEGNVIEGGDTSYGEMEVSEVAAIDPSEVSLEKVTEGELSEAEIVDVIHQAADLNGVSRDPEVRSQFVNTWIEMGRAESGFNPNAANGYDSNAIGAIQSDGFPAQSSRGIWQTIPTTFAAHHVAGTSTSIYDPVASAASSMAYTMDRYNVDPNTGAGLAEFAGARGIDHVNGGTYGAYKGY